jgi:hypothetical protein
MAKTDAVPVPDEIVELHPLYGQGKWFRSLLWLFKGLKLPKFSVVFAFKFQLMLLFIGNRVPFAAVVTP